MRCEGFLTKGKNAVVAVILFVSILWPLFSVAGQIDGNKNSLIIGTKLVAPFVMKTPSGEWAGLSIDLWREIAERLNLSYRFEETQTVGELINGVKEGKFALGVAALGITSEREMHVDFTHPFYSAGLGIAVSAEHGNPWFSVIKRFLSPAFLKVLITLVLLLVGVGALVWWFERKRNPEQFGKGPSSGIGSGFWWSAVTMTTVGYGDKAPVTTAGRFVALVRKLPAQHFMKPVCGWFLQKNRAMLFHQLLCYRYHFGPMYR